MIIDHANRTHAATCVLAEGARQQAVSAATAAGGGSATVAAAVRASEVIFYRTVRDSAIANGQQSAQFYQALRDLGTGGA